MEELDKTTQIIKSLDEISQLIKSGNYTVKQIEHIQRICGRTRTIINKKREELEIESKTSLDIDPEPDPDPDPEHKSKCELCYMCKTKVLDSLAKSEYNANMCTLCGALNQAKRNIKINLSGSVGIVTGGRVKIGYYTALSLLTNGCEVIVTSRFVDDCLDRYKAHEQFESFKSRLHIYQLNMLDSGNIKKFVDYVHRNFTRLDFLINNAAQTIKRPKEFYAQQIQKVGSSVEDAQLIAHSDVQELKYLGLPVLGLGDVCNPSKLLEYGLPEHLPDEITKIFPPANFDIFGQQIDLRPVNSWVLEADQVELGELAEVYIINTIGPYILDG